MMYRLRIPSAMYNLMVMLLLSFTLSACGGGDSKSNSSDELSSKNIIIKILDVDGSEFTQSVNVNLSGADFVDANQNAITSITYPTTKTFQAKIASDAEADVKLLAKTSDYVDSGVTLQLDPDTTDYNTTLYLVPNETGSVKNGIYTQVDSISDVIDGVAQKDITLVLEESASTPKLTVTIPDETNLSDSEGNLVTPDSSTLVRYDPLEPGVLEAYPGGLNVVADVNGNMEQVNFKSAGFASIVLQNSAGEKVKKFDQDITIAMQFKIGITDNTGTVAEVDDIVPIWSFDEDDGTWKFERNGIVKDLDPTDGLYDVTFQTDHLTFYNLDWDIENVCNATINVHDDNGVSQTSYLNVNLTIPAYNVERDFFYLGDGVINLLNVPSVDTPWNLVFTNPNTQEVVGEYNSTESMCDTEHTAITTIETDDAAKVYSVTAETTSGGAECDDYTGFVTVTNETQVSGTVAGLNISGTRNANSGVVSFGLVGNTNATVATFGGSINNTQGSGTWNDSTGSCSGTWTATLQ